MLGGDSGAQVSARNDVWCIDFKGWFLTGDGARCEPLTLSDAHSRYLLRCQVMARNDVRACLAGARCPLPRVWPAAATDESVGRLFLGGAVPGAMLGLFLMVQAYFVAKRNNYPREQRVPYGERFKATIVGLPVLLIPVVVLGSILAGIATPTEAAVLGVIAVIVFALALCIVFPPLTT